MEKEIHIIKHGKTWSIKKKHNLIATKLCETKQMALDYVISNMDYDKIIIHKKNGMVNLVINRKQE